MNHRWRAEIRKLPACPECNAGPGLACRTNRADVRAPHRSRERVHAGLLFVVDIADARAAKKLRAIRELVAAIRGVV